MTAHVDTLPPPSPAVVRVGEWVDYVLSLGPRKGEVRPAMVVRLEEAGEVLAVFTAGSPDGNIYARCPTLRTARWSAEREPGTWHR